MIWRSYLIGTRRNRSATSRMDRYDRMLTFMREDVLPAEPEYLAAGSAAGPSGHEVSPVIERLKGPGEVGRPVEHVPSLGVGDHPARVRPIAELAGWSNDRAPEAINC